MLSQGIPSHVVDRTLQEAIRSGDVTVVGARSEAPISGAISKAGLPGRIVGGITGLVEKPLRMGAGLIAEEIGQARGPQDDFFDKLGRRLLTPEEQTTRQRARATGPGKSEAQKSLMKRGVKQAAGAASLLTLPGGRAVPGQLSPLSQAIKGGQVGTAAKIGATQGAVSGGLAGFAGSEEGEGLGGAIGGAGTGALIGGAFSGGLAGINRGQQALKARAENINARPESEKGFKSIKITGETIDKKDNLYRSSIRDAMQNQSDNLKISKTMTPDERISVLADDVAKIDDDITNKLTGKSIDRQSLYDDLTDRITDTEFDFNAKKNEGTINKWFTKLDNAGDDAASLNTGIKKELTDEVAKIRSKIAGGGSLSPKEEFKLALWESVRGAIGKVDDEVARLNTIQNLDYRLADEFGKAAKSDTLIRFKIPFIEGLDIDSRLTREEFDAIMAGISPLQGNGGLLGRVSDSATKQIAKLPLAQLPKLPGAIAPAGFAATALSAGAISPVSGDVEVPVTDTAMQGADSAIRGATSGLDLSQENLERVLMEDIQSTGGQNIDKIISTYEKLSNAIGTGGGIPGNVGKVSAQSYTNASRALENLDKVQEIYDKSFSPTGKLLSRTLTGGLATRDLDQLTYNAADILLRLRTGAQANESEIKKIQKQLFPMLGDSRAVVNSKLKERRADFEAIIRAGGSLGVGE